MAIARVGGSTKAFLDPGTGFTANYTPAGTGHLLVLSCVCGNGSTDPLPPTVKDNLNASWTVVASTLSTNNQRAWIAYRANNPTGITSVTASGVSNANTFFTFNVTEWSGVDTVTPFNTSLPATGADPLSSGNLTASGANNLILGIGVSDDSAASSWGSPGASWTQEWAEGDTTAHTAGLFIYQMNAGTTGPYSASFHYLAATTTDASLLVSFNAATAAAQSYYSDIASNRNRPGRGPFSSGRFFVESIDAITSVANVTVGLTGQSMTGTPGTLSPTTSPALLGQSAVSSAGTLIPGLSPALTGISGTLTSGLLVPNLSIALQGQSATFTAGTLTVSGSGDVTVSLLGQAATFSAGALSPTTTIALNGQPITSSPGILLPGATLALTGVSATHSAGTVAPASAAPLPGLSATFTPGQMGVVGDVTVALTGAQAVFTAGQILVAAPVAADAGRSRRRVRSIYRVTIDGQVFECRTMSEALTLLDEAKKLAARVAAEKSKAAIAAQNPAPLIPPRITADSRDLRAAVNETQREIAQTYQQASIDIELAMLMELDDRTKHNDDVIFLM